MLLPPRDQRDLMPPSLQCKAHGGVVLCVAEIGIYRCTEEQHLQQMSDAESRKTAHASGSELAGKVLREHFSNRYWTPWRYNQTVGWLRIYAYPRQRQSSPILSGEYFAIDAKRLSASLTKKRFLWAGEAFATVIEHERGLEVFHRVTNDIGTWAKSERIRKLTLDLLVWMNIGEFVNWDRLLNLG